MSFAMWHIKYGKVYSNHEFQFEIMWQRMHINFSLCQPYVKGLWNGDKKKWVVWGGGGAMLLAYWLADYVYGMSVIIILLSFCVDRK